MSLYDKASLVLIPSGTKTSKVYSQVPTNGDGDFTFSRSTAATRVNASGNIEKETQNLLTYSNAFSNWSPKRGTLVQGVTNPFGGNDAWSLTATDADPYLYNQTAWSGVVTLSIWAKGVGSSIGKPIQLRMGGSFKEYTLTSEWQRFEHFANGSASNIGIEVPNPAVAGDVVHIYGAQLEQGLVARDYIETTTTAIYGGITDNVPRLDYTDSSCPALLLEPQRTNLFNHSEYFGDWGVSAGTLTANAGTSPEGLNNAYLFTEDTTTGYHRFAKNAGASGSNKTFSVYAKWAGGTGSKWLTLDNGPVGYFDLENGVVGTAQGSLSLSMEDAGDGWYRCTIYNPASVTGTMYIGCANTNGGAGNHLGNGQPAFYVYGAQCEDNSSYATSYIPTYGSAVTRNAETCGTSSNASTFNSIEGVLYFEGSALSNDLTFKRICIGTSDALFTNNVGLRFDNNGTSVTYQFRSGNVYQAELTTGINQADVNKLACVWKENRFELWKNGLKVGEDTSGSVPPANTFDAVFYGKTSTLTEALYGKTKQVLVFKTALSNEELAALTTI